MAMTLAPAAARAVIVPDAAHWAAAGVDILELGIEPVAVPSRADLLVLPANVPSGLEDAVREARTRLPDPGSVRIVEGTAIRGPATTEVITTSGSDADGAESDRSSGEAAGHDHDSYGAHEGEDGGGHEEMMAVTGEPSSDGLVMEGAEAAIGPLGPALATGLVWHATLDGDVVCKSRIESVVGGTMVGEGTPDPLARSAWRWAIERADPSAAPDSAEVASGVVAVEVERALSHLMWLARFARTLGLLTLAHRLHGAAGPLIRIHAELVGDRDAPPELFGLDAVRDALHAAGRSGGLRSRTRGIGVVSAEECRERGGTGPVARAAGIAEDARASDPAYAALGFVPAVETAGDAEARIAVRIDETLASLALAAGAAAAGELPAVEGAVEGPRGPLTAGRDGPGVAVAPIARGASATRGLAAASACGHELARAVVAVASFDLSPWAVGG